MVRYGYGDPSAYRWQRVVVLGGGNGAAEAALRLHSEGRAYVTAVYSRSGFHPMKWRWHLPDIADLIQGGAIQALFDTTVERVEPEHLVVSSRGETRRIPPQELIRTVLNDILTLLCEGKLSWRPAPLGRHDRLA